MPMTGFQTRWYSYFVVGVFGFVALIISAVPPRIESSPLLAVAVNAAIGLLVYAAFGFLSGALWPEPGWKWGLVLILPLLAVLMISLAFAGYFGVFLRKDVPVLIASFGGGGIAAHFAARWIARTS